jgi:hypothetical protein
MKNKLVLIFADEHEVLNVDKVLVFNNILDAEEYLISKGLSSIKIEPEYKWFDFKTIAWSGNGKAYWAKDLT